MEILKISQIFLFISIFVSVQCDVSHLPPEVLAAAAQRQHLRHLQPPHHDGFSAAASDLSPYVVEEADLHTTSTHPPPPHPYVFSYSAGRFPGHYDRTHTETSDGSGTVRGSYSYVDPRHEVRTVEYVADKHGFHPALSHPAPAETISVSKARERHYQLFNKIAEQHAHYQPHAPINPHLPQDTEAVNNAKIKHLTLFEKIAAEHARIAADRAAEKEAAELASGKGFEYDNSPQLSDQHSYNDASQHYYHEKRA